MTETTHHYLQRYRCGGVNTCHKNTVAYFKQHQAGWESSHTWNDTCEHWFSCISDNTNITGLYIVTEVSDYAFVQFLMLLLSFLQPVEHTVLLCI